MTHRWVTNSAAAAKRLREIDNRYDAAREDAAALPLAEKVAAFRRAKLLRDIGYDRVAAGDAG